MAGINKEYVESLFALARKEGRLEDLYRSAITYANEKDGHGTELPEELRELVFSEGGKHRRALLDRFLSLAGQELQIVDVEVISAVELTPQQRVLLEQQMIRIIKKRLNIKLVVDPSIIGGLRVIVGNHVVDSSIKSQLDKLKEKLYEGVYFHHESNPK